MDNQANLYDSITIKNIDAGEFEVIYGGDSYGILPAGAVKKYPRFLAEHAVKHLIDQVLNRRGIPTSNVVERKKLAGEIVVYEEQFDFPKPLSETERVKQQVEEINKTSDLAGILNRHKVENAEPVLPIAPVVPQNLVAEDNVLPEDPGPAQQEAPSDIPPPPVASPVTQTGTPIEQSVVPAQTPVTPVLSQPTDTVVPEAPTVVSRQVLYDYARNVMKINIDDPKTFAAFESMGIDQLKQEIQYEG